MLKKYAGLVLIGLIINLTFGGFVYAQDTETRAAEKAKIKVVKLGVGGKLTEVKFKDKTKIRGYITEIKEDYFVLVSKKNAASTNVRYDQVKDVGRTFTTFQKIAVGTGVTFGAVFLITLICVANGRCAE